MMKSKVVIEEKSRTFTAQFVSGVTMDFELPPGQDKMFFFKKECKRLGVEPLAVLS